MYSLAWGPMSQEVIEAIYRSSIDSPCMLICSRNQIDYNHGYVSTTRDFAERISRLYEQYPDSDVKVCRDHCGPGFGNPNDSMESAKETIRTDIECGFSLIHIDLCHLAADHAEKLDRSAELIQFARSLNPAIEFEIGTDENVGHAETDIKRIEADVEFFLRFCKPVFYVAQTGSLVKRVNNVGEFHCDAAREISTMLHSKDIRFKEHNADYLSHEQLRQRVGIVDALNIAPQLGVIHTSTVLNACLVYGIDISEFLLTVYREEKWTKWVLPGDDDEVRFCALVAGHYHFHDAAYLSIIDQLTKHCDIREAIIENVSAVISFYRGAFNEDRP